MLLKRPKVEKVESEKKTKNGTGVIFLFNFKRKNPERQKRTNIEMAEHVTVVI